MIETHTIPLPFHLLLMKLLPFLAASMLTLATTQPQPALAQTAPSWAQSVGGPAFSDVTRVVTDASNYTFVAGNTRGNATFGTQLIPAGGPQLFNGFVARLDPSGAVQWVRYLAPAGSGLETVMQGLALDAAGNVVVAGYYANGSLTLGGSTLPAPATANAANGVVAKLGPAGNVLWAQPLAQPNASTSATAVAVDASGVVYAATSSHTASLRQGLGLRTFSAAGVPGLGADFPGMSGDATTSPLGVYGAIDELVVNPRTGQLGAMGVFHGTLTLRAAGPLGPELGFTSPPEPRTGAYVMGLDATGAPQWAQELTSTGFTQNGRTGSFLNRLSSITPAGSGFAVAGSYLGAGTLAGVVLLGSPASDNTTGVVGRFDGQGQLLWSQTVSGDGNPGSGALASGVATDGAGQLHVAGSFFGQLAASGGGFISAGGLDLLLMRYSDQGQLLGSQRDGSYGSERPSALALDPTGQPRVVGTIQGTCSFGGVGIASGSQANGFVARVARTPLAARAASPAQVALQVFPNPSAGASELQVSLLPGAGPTTLRLLDALGRPVHTQTVPALRATATVPTAALTAGHYVLQTIGAGGVATRSVVIE
jgi:hypothetical protein